MEQWECGLVVLGFFSLQSCVGLVASSIFWRLARLFAFLIRVVGAWRGVLVVDNQVPGAEASEQQRVGSLPGFFGQRSWVAIYVIGLFGGHGSGGGRPRRHSLSHSLCLLG